MRVSPVNLKTLAYTLDVEGHASAPALHAGNDMPIKQVADELGFSSVHSFHRAFKRWTGVTPTTWKQG